MHVRRSYPRGFFYLTPLPWNLVFVSVYNEGERAAQFSASWRDHDCCRVQVNHHFEGVGGGGLPDNNGTEGTNHGHKLWTLHKKVTGEEYPAELARYL